MIGLYSAFRYAQAHLDGGNMRRSTAQGEGVQADVGHPPRLVGSKSRLQHLPDLGCSSSGSMGPQLSQHIVDPAHPLVVGELQPVGDVALL